MEIILLEKITNLGGLGDQVKVANGYGRNYLIPQGKAVPATAENIAEFEARRAELEKHASDALVAAQAKGRELELLTVEIERKAGDEGKLFGSVGTRDIAEALTEKVDFEVKKSEVRLPDGALRLVGEYDIDVNLHTDVTCVVKVHVVAEE